MDLGPDSITITPDAGPTTDGSVEDQSGPTDARPDEGGDLLEDGASPTNEPPAVNIELPEENASVPVGEELEFRALISDDKYVPSLLSVRWLSDRIDDPISTKKADDEGISSFTWIADVPGPHVIRCEVTDIEGEIGSDEIVVMVNSPPSAPLVHLEPENPISTQTLTVVIDENSTDPDRVSAELSYDFTWYRNGNETNFKTSSIASTVTEKGETWTVEVRAFDGNILGPPGTDSVTVDNGVPTTPGVEIQANAPEDSHVLTCMITQSSTDADGEEISYEYAWYQNDTLVDGLEAEEITVSATPIVNPDPDISYLIVANQDVLSCAVIAYDVDTQSEPGLSQDFLIDEETLNEAPTIISEPTLVAEENEPYVYAMEVLDSDDPNDGESLTFTLLSAPDGMIVSPVGVINWTPPEGVSTSGLITVTVADGGEDGADLAVQSFTISVDIINDPPTEIYFSQTSTPENLMVGFGVAILTNNDPDVNDVHTYTLINDSNGTFALDGNALILNKAIDYETAQVHTVVVRCEDDGTPPLYVEKVQNITVQNINEPVIVFDEFLSMNHGETQIIDILDNDYDVDGDPLILESVEQPVYGTLSQNPDQTITYTAPDQWSGIDSFSYVASDGSGESASGVVEITVSFLNQIPTISAISDQTIYENESAGPTNFFVWDNDGELANLEITAVSSNPALVPDENIVLGGSGQTRALTVTPVTNGFGEASITVTVDDGIDTAETTFLLTVISVNSPPTLSEFMDLSLLEDAPEQEIFFQVSDEDTPQDEWVVSLTVDNHALFPDDNVVLLGAGENRSIRFTPSEDGFGVAVFEITVFDGIDEVKKSFTVTVDSVNDIPIGFPESYDTTEGTAVTIPAPGILANDMDVESSALEAILVSDASNGTLNLNVDGSFSYTPSEGFYGFDSFTYTASDGIDPSEVVTVTIQVSYTNHAPECADLSYTLDEDTFVEVTLDGTDIDQDALTYSVVTQPAHGVLSGTAPDLIYTPNPDYAGTDSFSYQANDGQDDSGVATATFTVVNLNDAPIAQTDYFVLNPLETINFMLVGSDPENSALSYSIETFPQEGAITGTAPNLQYTAPATPGIYNLSFIVNDGSLNSEPGYITLEVIDPNAINLPPTCDDQGVLIDPVTNNGMQITVTGSDPENGTLSFEFVTVPEYPAKGSVSGELPTFTFTPDTAESGFDYIYFKAFDGEYYSEPCTVIIHLGPLE